MTIIAILLAFALCHFIRELGRIRKNQWLTGWVGFADKMAVLGFADPQPAEVLNAEKVRYAVTMQQLLSFIDSACMCKFTFGPAWQLYDVSSVDMQSSAACFTGAVRT